MRSRRSPGSFRWFSRLQPARHRPSASGPAARHRGTVTSEIFFPPPPQKIVMVDPFQGAAAELEPLPFFYGAGLWDRIVAGYAIPDIDDVRSSRNGSSGTRRAPITSRAWSTAAGATCITSSARSRSAACRSRSRCCRWSRAHSIRRRFDEPRVGHLAVHAVDRQELRTEAELLVRFAARHRRGDRLARSIIWRSSTRTSATGSSRSRRTTGARATCARAIARNRAQGLPTDLREPQDAGRDAQLRAQAAGGEEHRPRPGSTGSSSPTFRRAVLRRRARRRARWTSSAPPSSPRCRWTSSCRSIRSTTGR